MSTFSGRMREYTRVSIDRFDGDNLASTVYCLSHNHADHTVGLGSRSLHYRLQSNTSIKLYCSEVTKNLLLWEPKYKHLERHIVALSEDTPTIIDIPDEINHKKTKQVTMTLLHAGHCPGSVMMLFEGEEGTVLYTGDFRLNKDNIMAMHHLMSNGGPKPIKSLYVDTTFCVPEAFYIPTREDSSAAIVEIAREWVCQGPEYVIHLKHRANLGYEYLYIILAEQLQTKVHVNKAKFDKYSGIPSLYPHLTTDGASTQVHMCRWHCSGSYQSPLPCFNMTQGSQPPKVRQIYVSTMFFVNAVRTDRYVRRKHERNYHVCYSFHSSYSEIRDMVLCLQPQRAFPNVNHGTQGPGNSRMKMQERVNQFVKLAGAVRASSRAVTPQPLGTLKHRHKSTTASPGTDSDDGMDFGSEDEVKVVPRQYQTAAANQASPQKKKHRRKPRTPSKEGAFCVDYSDDDDTDSVSQSQGRIHDNSDGESSHGSSYHETDDSDVDDALEQELTHARERLTNTPVKGESVDSSLSYVSDNEDDADVDPEVDEDENPEESQRLSTGSSLQSMGQVDESQVPDLQLSSLGESSVDATECLAPSGISNYEAKAAEICDNPSKTYPSHDVTGSAKRRIFEAHVDDSKIEAQKTESDQSLKKRCKSTESQIPSLRLSGLSDSSVEIMEEHSNRKAAEVNESDSRSKPSKVTSSTCHVDIFSAKKKKVPTATLR